MRPKNEQTDYMINVFRFVPTFLQPEFDLMCKKADY